MVDIKMWCEVPELAPVRAFSSDAGFDLKSIENIDIYGGQTELVNTGVHLCLPEEEDYIWYAAVVPRSGLSYKYGIRVANSPGTIDSGYRGAIKVIMHNLDNDRFRILKGDRIAQMVIHRVPKVNLIKVSSIDELTSTDRGSAGFGSTGK